MCFEKLYIKETILVCDYHRGKRDSSFFSVLFPKDCDAPISFFSVLFPVLFALISRKNMA